MIAYNSKLMILGGMGPGGSLSNSAYSFSYTDSQSGVSYGRIVEELSSVFTSQPTEAAQWMLSTRGE